MRSLLVALSVICTASVALAEVSTPAMPAANSGPAKSYARDAGSFAHAIATQCLAEDPAKFEARFKENEAAVAKFTDATDKAAWTQYLGKVRVIFKARVDGTPELGTFAAVRAKHQKLTTDIDALMPKDTALPPDLDQAKQLVQRVTAYKALVDDALATYEKVKDTGCPEKVTGNWWPLKNKAEAARQNVINMVSSLVEGDLRLLNQWVSNVPQNNTEPAKDWWKQMRYAGNVLEQVGKAQKFISKLDVLLLLAPVAGGSEASRAQDNAVKVKDYVAKNSPLVKQLLGETMLPKVPGTAKQVADFKKYMATFNTGKVLGTPASRKVTTSTYDEFDGGRKYKIVKKVYTSYYVWKANTPAENKPTIEGIAPDAICELWSRNLVMYEKGGPKHAPLKQWRGDQDILQGYMLCSNKDKKSPLPYVD